jgi:hypothetical protein
MVNAAQINVEDSHRADIVDRPSIPPKKEVLKKRYEYAPLNLPLPPITSNSFIHYMEYPDCPSLARTNKWLGCLPKKLRTQLVRQRLATDPNLNVTGWGIHIDESLNGEAVAIICVLIMIISGVCRTVILNYDRRYIRRLWDCELDCWDHQCRDCYVILHVATSIIVGLC